MAIGPEPRYQVEIAPSALKQLTSLPRKVQSALQRSSMPCALSRPHGVKKLLGVDDLYRVRVGSYRVVYTIRDDRLIVLVLRISDRKDVYRGGP